LANFKKKLITHLCIHANIYFIFYYFSLWFETPPRAFNKREKKMNAADEEKNIEGLIKLDFMKMLDGFPGS